MRIAQPFAFALERLAAVGSATEDLVATFVEAAALRPEPEAPEGAADGETETTEGESAGEPVEGAEAEGEAAASPSGPVLDAFDELANEAIDAGEAEEDAARDGLWGGPRN